MRNQLFCIAYFSTASSEVDDKAIDELVGTSVSNNARHDITGVLGYYDGSFFQILEGDEQSVKNVFRKVTNDRRNHSVITLYEAGVKDRSFRNWSMALTTPQMVKPERQAFCVKLDTLRPHMQSSHQKVVETAIDIFNRWTA